MKTATLTVAAAALAAVTFVAFAAQLGLVAAAAGGGAATIARCDTDGFSVSYAVSGPNLTSVTVDGIADPGCEGADVAATVTDASGGSLATGTGTVPTDAGTADNSLVIAVSPTPAETAVTGIQLAVTGP